jgi:hypothetical protein
MPHIEVPHMLKVATRLCSYTIRMRRAVSRQRSPFARKPTMKLYSPKST